MSDKKILNGALVRKVQFEFPEDFEPQGKPLARFLCRAAGECGDGVTAVRQHDCVCSLQRPALQGRAFLVYTAAGYAEGSRDLFKGGQP